MIQQKIKKLKKSETILLKMDRKSSLKRSIVKKAVEEVYAEKGYLINKNGIYTVP